MTDQDRQPTTEKLAKALEELKAPKWMIDNARNGVYDDFKSQYAMPLHVLAIAAQSQGLPQSFIDRVIDGEFDAQLWESEKWFQSPEGQQVLNELLDQRPKDRKE